MNSGVVFGALAIFLLFSPLLASLIVVYGMSNDMSSILSHVRSEVLLVNNTTITVSKDSVALLKVVYGPKVAVTVDDGNSSSVVESAVLLPGTYRLETISSVGSSVKIYYVSDPEYVVSKYHAVKSYGEIASYIVLGVAFIAVALGIVLLRESLGLFTLQVMFTLVLALLGIVLINNIAMPHGDLGTIISALSNISLPKPIGGSGGEILPIPIPVPIPVKIILFLN